MRNKKTEKEQVKVLGEQLCNNNKKKINDTLAGHVVDCDLEIPIELHEGVGKKKFGKKLKFPRKLSKFYDWSQKTSNANYNGRGKN